MSDDGATPRARIIHASTPTTASLPTSEQASPAAPAPSPTHPTQTPITSLQPAGLDLDPVIALRGLFLEDLLRQLDVLVFCELSVSYYLDCSLFRFFLRAVPQWLLLTPKNRSFPTIPARIMPAYTVALLVTNLLVLLTHMVFAAPMASEATRGYLHGGLLIDFVGERGPISPLRLAGGDLLIFTLQLVMLGIVLEQRDLKARMERTDGYSSDPASRPAPSQDIEAEERGVRRSTDIMVDAEGRADAEPSDVEAPTGHFSATADAHPSSAMASRIQSDALRSGQAVIAEVHIFGAMRRAWRLGRDGDPG